MYATSLCIIINTSTRPPPPAPPPHSPPAPPPSLLIEEEEGRRGGARGEEEGTEEKEEEGGLANSAMESVAVAAAALRCLSSAGSKTALTMFDISSCNACQTHIKYIAKKEGDGSCVSPPECCVAEGFSPQLPRATRGAFGGRRT